MKYIYSILMALLPAMTCVAQSYQLETKTAAYTEISSPEWEIPDNSPYFGNVSMVPQMTIKAFGNEYNLADKIWVPLKQGYAYVINNTHSTTFYAAKGVFTGRPGTDQTSEFSFVKEGISPNQVYIMQWQNMGFEGGDSTDFINFQLKLYEATNIIEIHFGPSSVSSGLWENGADGPTIGLLNMDDQFSTIYEQLWLQGAPSSPSMVTTNGVVTLSSTPVNGTLYRFIPSTTGIDEFKETGTFSIYPTLLRNEQTLNLKAREDLPYDFVLFDMSGKEVYRETDLSGNYDLKLPVLKSGIYLSRLTGEGFTEVVRLVISE